MRGRLLKDLRQNRTVYLLAIPMIIFFAVFAYTPMYGVIIAFQDYNLVKGVFGSKFVGFKYFLILHIFPDSCAIHFCLVFTTWYGDFLPPSCSP
jgi:putative aldouronate transport system permease protein